MTTDSEPHLTILSFMSSEAKAFSYQLDLNTGIWSPTYFAVFRGLYTPVLALPYILCYLFWKGNYNRPDPELPYRVRKQDF